MTSIHFDCVTKFYSGQTALDGFSLEIAESERVAVLGPSGCGKTTALRLLAGFIAPDSGRIVLGGEVVAGDGRIVRAPEERNLGMVFQDLALWPHLTVMGNIEFGLKARGVPRSERERRVLEVLQRVRMETYLNARPGELSGGQQQRVALARALVLRPRALLMDEPLSNLDADLNVRLRKEILRLHQSLGFTLLYVTHDRSEAFDIGTRVVVMARGRVRTIGSPQEIQEYYRTLSSVAADEP
jgi:iron(III) transport system ATP-binding protein